jgi:hypothetical protein
MNEKGAVSMNSIAMQKEVDEIAVMLTEENSPTCRDIDEMRGVASQLVNGTDWALKVASGELPRPDESPREWLGELQREADAMAHILRLKEEAEPIGKGYPEIKNSFLIF